MQKVERPYDVKDCNAQTISSEQLGGIYSSTYPRWEAWLINPNRKITASAEMGDIEDDTYAITSTGSGTQGTIMIKGTAEFYEGLTLPNSFSTVPWGLPTTFTDPSLSGGSGAIPHEMKATWNCCGADWTTKLDHR